MAEPTELAKQIPKPTPSKESNNKPIKKKPFDLNDVKPRIVDALKLQEIIENKTRRLSSENDTTNLFIEDKDKQEDSNLDINVFEGNIESTNEIGILSKLNQNLYEAQSLTNAYLSSLINQLIISMENEPLMMDDISSPKFKKLELPEDLNIKNAFDSLFDLNELEDRLDIHYDQETIQEYSQHVQSILAIADSISLTILTIKNTHKKVNLSHHSESYKQLKQVFEFFRVQMYEKQKKLAYYSKNINPFSLGHPRFEDDCADVIDQSFRVNPTIDQGYISLCEEYNKEAIEKGDIAEQTVNIEMSKSDKVVFVIGGPKWSKADTILKIDSIAFLSDKNIPEQDLKRLYELAYQISFGAYSKSLLDYNTTTYRDENKLNTSPELIQLKEKLETQIYYLRTQDNFIKSFEKSIRTKKLELVPLLKKKKDLESKLKNAEKSKTTIQFLEKDKQKAITSLKKGISNIEAQVEPINQYIEENKILKQKTSQSKLIQISEIEKTSIEIKSVNASYNPESPALSIHQNPVGKINIFRDGEQLELDSGVLTSETDMNILKQEFNDLIIKNNISIRTIQTKSNVHTPKVRNMIEDNTYTGALGIYSDTSNNLIANSLETSISLFLNTANVEAFNSNTEYNIFHPKKKIITL